MGTNNASRKQLLDNSIDTWKREANNVQQAAVVSS